MKRYSRKDVAVVLYHLHIPAPDPMTNPSTLARAESCQVRGTPSYAIDGDMMNGGGPRSETKIYYDKLNTEIEKRLEAPAEAQLKIDAFREKGAVKVEVAVDRVTRKSPNLNLQIALVEDRVTYSGEGGLRFHPMVVRSLAGEKAGGFAVNGSGPTTIEHTFDLAKVTEEAKAHLEDFEKERDMTFRRKRYQMNEAKLSVVVFVQDIATKKVLQSAFVKVK